VPSLLAERDENEVRKDFTPPERVQMGESIKAQRGNTHGGIGSQTIKSKKPLDAKMAGFGNSKRM
jgi:hypothetical protein